MDDPLVVSREEWLAAHKELLAREKELTRQRDALNTERRRLPMVEIDKEYIFEGTSGKASLLEVFEGRSQLPDLALHVAAGRRPGLPVLLVPGRQHRPPRPPARTRHLPGRGHQGAAS